MEGETKMTENEEFEFRHRLETEQDASSPDSTSFLSKTGKMLSESKTLPIAGGLVGALVGGGIPGAALGGSAGEAGRQLLSRSMGLPSPQTAMDASIGIGKQGAIQGGSEALGQYVLSPIAKAALPYAKSLGKGIAGQLESITGSNAGSISKAFGDSSLIVSKGRQIASNAYDVAKSVGGKLRDEFRSIANPSELVDAAMSSLDNLNPTEALEGRKALDQIKNRVTKDYYYYAREKLDAIAKPIYKKADELFERGVNAESLRSIFPRNKKGGVDMVKMFASTALGSVLPGFSKLAPLALSPAISGATATGLGLATRYGAKTLIQHPQLATLGMSADKE